jgi:hypothetical protein
MKELKSVKLSKWQLLSHYWIVPFLLVVPILTTYSLFQIYITKSYKGIRNPNELVQGYLWIIPVVIFYFIQKKRLEFQEIKGEFNINNVETAINETAKLLNWEVYKKKDNYFIAIRRGGFTSGSWGEMITIIAHEDKILINSICDPDNITSIASWGWNKKNVRTFKQILENIKSEK